MTSFPLKHFGAGSWLQDMSLITSMRLPTYSGKLTFFGYEFALNRFEFLYELDNAAKVLSMARKAAEGVNEGVRRFFIHPAYHSYLELKSATTPGQLSIDL
jgi:hypothetical protein